MPVCNACSAEDHEQEDCRYRERAADFWRAGIQVTACEAREMDENARRTA